MMFRDRQEAGRQLAELLEKYKDEAGVVYGLPRGGVVVALEIARKLDYPLDLILAHKIGHPFQPEYAIAAISESGQLVASPHEVAALDEVWFEEEKQRQMKEIKRKRELYLKGRKEIPVKDKVAIIVDDGIATGLTMQAGIKELKLRHPKKIIAAVPVSPQRTAQLLETMVDEVVAVYIPEDYKFFGAVGAYYEDFRQVEDEEVIVLLQASKAV